MADLLALKVTPPVALRLSRYYPPDYVQAWIAYVQKGAESGEISRPAAYLVRCLQAGQWPPQRASVPEVAPRPDPASQAPPRASGGPRFDRGGVPNLPRPEADTARRQQATVASRVQAYLAAQDDAGRALLEAQARQRIAHQPVPEGCSPQAWLSAAVTDLIAEILGLEVES